MIPEKSAAESSAPPSVVAYTAYSWVHALTSLRLVKPFEYAGITLIHGNELELIYPERVDQADVVVIQRDFPVALELYEQILARAHAQGKPVIYEIDDLLLDLPAEHPDTALQYYTPALLPMIRAMIEADLVTVTTPTLAEYIYPFNPHVCVLPNYLDDQSWKLRPPQEKPSAAPVTIGYMGSNTHQPDLESITPVLIKLLERYEAKIKLHFWGGEPPPALLSHSNVTWTRLEIYHYAEFAAYFSLQECDIFIAPLLDTPFNRCKSAIKLLEYSALGAPGVYSHLPPYEAIIKHGQNGFLASSLEEWEDCLIQLIEQPGLRFVLAQQAQEVLRENCLLSQHAGYWLDAYRQAQKYALDRPAHNTRPVHLAMLIQVANQITAFDQVQRRRIAQAEQTSREYREQLQEKERFQQELLNSTTWRLVQWAWKLRLLLIPLASRRERWLHTLTNRLRALFND